MLQQDLAALLAELKSSLSSTTGADNAQTIQQKIAPALVADFKQNLTTPAPTNPAMPAKPVLPANNFLLSQSPAVVAALKGTTVQKETDQIKIGGAGILNTITPATITPALQQWQLGLHFDEFISVYLATDTTTPVLMLPVSVSVLSGFHLPGQGSSYPITKGSVWIFSQLLCGGAPTDTYTGLTVSGGTIAFNQPVTLSNKSIIIPNGAICTVELNLVQPLDTTVPPENIGIDAANAQLELPPTFNFNFSGPVANITAIGSASWNLYGSFNTFTFDATQATVYNAALNSIFVGFTVSAPTFTVSACNSPFFSIQGTAPIHNGFWELPVQTIDITKINTAIGTGALAAICTPGLQVSWSGVQGGMVELRLPLISATIGIIGITDVFAGNVYATQQLNLWANAVSGFPSTLILNFGELFTIYYLCFQSGEELLTADTAFNAQIDRPLRVDGSPVVVQGTNALMYQLYTPTDKSFFLFDLNLIVEDYTPVGGGAVTEVPQQAIALTNALLTITPATGIMLYGKLDSPNSFTDAAMILMFGLYYLVPSLPDPYASTFALVQPGRIGYRDFADTGISELPLSNVTDLLFSIINWTQTDPILTNLPAPTVAFGIAPLPGNDGVLFAGNTDTDLATSQTAGTGDALLASSDNQSAWQRNTTFSVYDLAMLDVSTNADLMGVSFSTMNIRAEGGDGDNYTIKPQNNAGEADFLKIIGMDLAVPGKFIRAFTVPEITWEPTINLTKPAVPGDPPLGWLLFGDDGGPTQIFNNSPTFVPIAPVTVSEFLVGSTQGAPVQGEPPLVTASIFTLPFGMRAMAFIDKGAKTPGGYVPPTLTINPPNFDLTLPGNPIPNIVTGGLQIIAKGQQTTVPGSSASFPGLTVQLRNLLNAHGTALPMSILGPDVDTIFEQFSVQQAVGVPLERIDFSGYGASIFSNWQDPNATIAATSQAKFDVFVGRTSLEIIQVKSLIYPWGIRVVRTITMYRVGSALIYRVDSGWRAETDGVYDFSYKDYNKKQIDNPYAFYPGVVKGVFNVTNIVDNDLPQFELSWHREPGPNQYYIEPLSQVQELIPSGGVTEKVELQPVYFDADVLIDNVVQGAFNGKVPSKQMVGYVQLAPRGEPISKELFSELLISQAGSLGGPVDCIVNIGMSGQQMRLNRVEVSNSIDNTISPAIPVFTGTARGTVILPKEGSWSMVQHSQATDVVSAIANNASIPLIRDGLLQSDGSSDYPANQLRLANPMDLLKAPDNSTINYALLQNTGTQKTLFQLPAYVQGVTQLQSKGNSFPLAKFADAYHLMSSVSAFPNPATVPDMDMSKYGLNVIKEGFQLVNSLNVPQMLTQPLPTPWYFVKTQDVKLYIIYNNNGDTTPNLNYDLDSSAEMWKSTANNITLNVDLGPFTQLVYITGNMQSQNGIDTGFQMPQMQFGPAFNPIVQILELLGELSGSDYAAVAQQALSIAMGNSGDNYQYKFHADKQIPTIQFPPDAVDSPLTPLRLTADLKVGAYFNESMSITSNPSSLIPSAGAYFQFDGGLQVMCLSVAVGTVYAVGQVTVRVSADTVTGPALYLKFGFGVELMVGLPVVGNVSVTFMAGVEMNLTSTEIAVTAFILFKGEADLLGGLVDITITIEASGTIDRTTVAPESTTITAQVTFSIDISIFLVINIDFSKSWSESKPIA